MDKVRRFFELKELWKQSPQQEREHIDRQIKELLDAMDTTETEYMAKAVAEDLHCIRGEAEEISLTLTVRERLEKVLPFISVSALAKKDFGKSASWFYQRLNGNAIHGKTAAFTKEELRTLSSALKDVAAKLSQAAEKVA